MAKMNKKWIVLCSSAVAAVYASGFLTTASQAAIIQPKQHAQAAVQTSNNQPKNNQLNKDKLNNNQTNKSANSTVANTTTNSTTNKTTRKSLSTTSTTARAVTPTSKFKDGTYHGTGMNRRGSIEVAVTIKSDKISDVEISNWGMHYSESDIEGLPGEVLQNQSVQVRNVSGATYSTQAFKDAVQNAITKAENA